MANLKDLTISGQPLTDWIVEQGYTNTSTLNCFYRKYNSGIIEIFANTDQKTIACTQQYGNSAIVWLCIIQVIIPDVKMLKVVLYQHVEVDNQHGLLLARCYRVNINDGKAYCMIMDSTKSISEAARLRFHIVGKWK